MLLYDVGDFMNQMSQMESCMNMQDMGWMMASMWFIGALWVLLLILGIAALTKYLFFARK